MTQKQENKFENFAMALKRLNEMNVRYKKNKNTDYYDMARDSLIKRFEFTFELAWKCLREFLIISGYTEANSPRSVFKLAYEEGYIDNEEIWAGMINDRNLSAHIYKEDQAEELAKNISMRYCKELSALKKIFDNI